MWLLFQKRKENLFFYDKRICQIYAEIHCIINGRAERFFIAIVDLDKNLAEKCFHEKTDYEWHGLIGKNIHRQIELERQNVRVSGRKRDMYYLASQYLNLYGGTHILNYYSENEIKEKVMFHIKQLAVNSRSV